MRSFSFITFEQRMKIKTMLEENIPVSEIAKELGKPRQSVYREINRGYNGQEYDPFISEEKYRQRLKNKGKQKKLERDLELAQYISDCILIKKLSPEKTASQLTTDERFKDRGVTKVTIYKAIDAGIIPGVSRDSLKSHSVKIFSNGQIIIPQWIRNELDLSDGDTLQIRIIEGNITLAKNK